MLGYFTLALKPLTIRGETVSNTTKRKLLRVSELDVKSDTYTMSAYLIAQLGKNYADGRNREIAGKDTIYVWRNGNILRSRKRGKIIIVLPG